MKFIIHILCFLLQFKEGLFLLKNVVHKCSVHERRDEEIEFKIDDMNKFYTSRVWRLGCDINKKNKVIEAYAMNECTAYFTVRGSIDYTVVIQKDDGKTNMECNCPYMGFCKHEVAVL